MNDEPSQPLGPEHPAPTRVEVESKPRPQRQPAARAPGQRIALILFLATCSSTFFAGTNQFPAGNPLIDPRTGKTVIDPSTGEELVEVTNDPVTHREEPVIEWRKTLLNGLMYATAVMVMLGAHEMGHYLQARRYGVPASLPMFIPMPFGPLGTMGAVIVQQAGVADRKSMFDIAISGPLAGLALALPLAWWGVQHSRIVPIDASGSGWNNPLLLEWMIGWIQHPLKPGQDIRNNPILFAGQVGFFITALNLIPIGQLDGGHILYCLIGKTAHLIARTVYLGAIAYVVYQVLHGHVEYSAWSLMLILIWLMGTRHPPTANDNVPLGMTRIVLGWLTLAFIFVGFVSFPTYQPGSMNAPRPPNATATENPRRAATTSAEPASSRQRGD